MNSPFFAINVRDVLKGAVVAFLSGLFMAIETLVQNMIATHAFVITQTDEKTVLAVAVTAALGYLVKQLVTDENGKIGGVL